MGRFKGRPSKAPYGKGITNLKPIIRVSSKGNKGRSSGS